MPLIVDNDAGLRGAAVNGAALGAAEDLEMVGELRDTDNAAFTDDAGVVDPIPGGEEAMEAPAAVDPDIYRDYYDI